MAEYLKLSELARRLDVSEKTARRMVKGGKLPAVFIGNAYRVSEEDVEAYLRGAKVEPGGGPPLFEPEAPRLDLSALFDVEPPVRRRTLEAATQDEVGRYLADLDRALERASREPEEGDTEDTRRQLAEYERRLKQMKVEAEVFGGLAHASVAGQRGA
jgi:excisionase family DNA binding protein